MILSLRLLVALLVLPVPSAPQQAQEVKQPATIRTGGEHVIIARPDQAEIEIGVVTQGPTAEAATAQNAQIQGTVLKNLRAQLDKLADIKTTGYSVTPIYRYPKEGSPTVSGYSASNVVQVTVADPAQAGRVIDLALQSGANRIERLRFSLKDEQAVQLAALREAAVKARAKAQALVEALGLQVLRIRQVDEAEEPAQPFMERSIALAESAPRSAPTQVEPGTLEVRARVTLIVEVGPR